MKKKYKKKIVLIVISTALICAVLLGAAAAIAESSLSRYRNFFVALDCAQFTNYETKYLCSRISENKSLLEILLDGGDITAEDLKETMNQANRLGGVIEPEKMSSFVYHFLSGTKSSKLTVGLFLKYNSKELRNIKLPDGYKEFFPGKESEDGPTAEIIPAAVSEITKIGMLAAKRYSELSEVRQDSFSESLRLIINDDFKNTPVRDLLLVLNTAANSMSESDGGNLSKVFAYAGFHLLKTDETDSIVDLILSAPELCKAVVCFAAGLNDNRITDYFFDLPDTDLVAENILESFYLSEYCSENKETIEKESDLLLEKLANIRMPFAARTLHQLVSGIIQYLQ